MTSFLLNCQGKRLFYRRKLQEEL